MALSSKTPSWVKLMTATLHRTTFSIKMQKNVIQLNGMKKHVIKQNAIQIKVVQHNHIVMTFSCMMISWLILSGTKFSSMSFSIMMSLGRMTCRKCHSTEWQQNGFNQYGNKLSAMDHNNTKQNNIHRMTLNSIIFCWVPSRWVASRIIAFSIIIVH
jgi:hypothetical protein